MNMYHYFDPSAKERDRSRVEMYRYHDTVTGNHSAPLPLR